MKILIINSVCGIKSTGRICADIADELSSAGHEVKIAYGRETVPEKYSARAYRIGTDWSLGVNVVTNRIFDNDGFCAQKATKQFLKWADDFNPDILWLHNLHGYYINIALLFQWIKSRPQMEVRWTLHDCWAFTGHCAHFSYAKCEKWKTGCFACVQKRVYPSSFFKDASKTNWEKKKQLFTGVPNMTLITPSCWLADLVKQSFLKDYPVEVRYNTVDTDAFCSTQGDFREKHHLENKKIILGVGSIWNKKKGFDDFLRLAEMIDEDTVIVLVGVSAKQIKKLPKNVVGVEHTNSTKTLAELYTTADVFVNLTYEDTYPTVNLEAKACNTPVITYRTGGSVESVDAENIVEQGDLKGIKQKIDMLVKKKKHLYKEDFS